MRIYVIRSLIGQTLKLGELTIQPWKFIEVEGMTDEARIAVVEARGRRHLQVAVVEDGSPLSEVLAEKAIAVMGNVVKQTDE